ncbi:MAG: hypothetical protein HYZ51_01570 [Candidatus Doudnabacteria bacterium]|nr:hypothetical protein [Candidatus Doudnabacteria bacterium]
MTIETKRPKEVELAALEQEIRQNPARDEMLNILKTKQLQILERRGTGTAGNTALSRADQLVPDFRVKQGGELALNFNLRQSLPEGGYSETIFADPSIDAVNSDAWNEIEKTDPAAAKKFKAALFRHQILKLQESTDYWQKTVDDMKANPKKYDPKYGRPDYQQHERRIESWQNLSETLKTQLQKLG